MIIAMVADSFVIVQITAVTTAIDFIIIVIIEIMFLNSMTAMVANNKPVRPFSDSSGY